MAAAAPQTSTRRLAPPRPPSGQPGAPPWRQASGAPRRGAANSRYGGAPRETPQGPRGAQGPPLKPGRAGKDSRSRQPPSPALCPAKPEAREAAPTTRRQRKQRPFPARRPRPREQGLEPGAGTTPRGDQPAPGLKPRTPSNPKGGPGLPRKAINRTPLNTRPPKRTSKTRSVSRQGWERALTLPKSCGTRINARARTTCKAPERARLFTREDIRSS